MFLHLSVILFTGGGNVHPQGRHPWADTPWAGPPPPADTPPETATAADAMDPLGMHFCNLKVQSRMCTV